MFKLILNSTYRNQIVYDDYGEPLYIPPYCTVDGFKITYNVNGLDKVENYIDMLRAKEIKRFYIRRTYALGDVLMLVPVIRYLRTLGYDPYLLTEEKYMNILNLLGVRTASVRGIELRGGLNDYGIQLNGTVEKDHYQLAFQKFHRIEIYLKALGICQLPRKIDWDCDLSKFPTIDCRKKNYIVFQGQGSTNTKSLPEASVRFLIKALNKDGVSIVYIGNPINVEGIDKRRTEFRFFNQSLPQLFSIIAGAKCLISMDSGPFWISHFVKTPAIIILGSVDGQRQIRFHPLYPEGVRFAQLNKEIGCNTCFENAQKCDFRYDCLKIPPERIYSLIRRCILKFWKV